MDSKTIRPIFILSLPRSGSTLLQRLMSKSDSICTAGETWLLLPLFLPLQGRFGFSQVNEHDMVEGLNGFLRFADRSGSDYHSNVREFAISLYTEACRNNKPDATCFLDKTPRYHLICRNIVKAFPDAAFIYLWRNPLDIAHSMIETWCGNRWNIHEFAVDLEFGLDRLAKCFRENGGDLLSMKYEDLVESPESTLEKLARFLQVDIPAGRELPEPQEESELGDRTGIHRYGSISGESVDNWRTMLNSTVRRRWIGRYLSVHSDSLKETGYSDLHERFSAACNKSRISAISTVRDLFWGTYYSIINRLNINTVRDQRSLFFSDPRSKLR